MLQQPLMLAVFSSDFQCLKESLLPKDRRLRSSKVNE